MKLLRMKSEYRHFKYGNILMNSIKVEAKDNFEFLEILRNKIERSISQSILFRGGTSRTGQRSGSPAGQASRRVPVLG